MGIFQRISGEPAPSGRVGLSVSPAWKGGWRAGWACLLLAVAMPVRAQGTAAHTAGNGKTADHFPEEPTSGAQALAYQSQRGKAALGRTNLPPRVIQAQRFLAERGWTQERRGGRTGAARANLRADGLRADGLRADAAKPQAQTAATATWQALGPTAVLTPNYGLVTGRVSALALDPSDSTGNRLYLGTTGGGVWVTNNAGTSGTSSITFTPLTDSVGVLSGVTDASISIGALTVQPGGTGVILAGTGDPTDALDSYYGAGILRSTDGGNTWSLIPKTADKLWGFAGEGFAGFAWSTVNPQLVVAAVSQAFEGTLVNAELPHRSYQGLYYSADGGVTWNLATITDGAGADVQGPSDTFAAPDGNAATSVVWNPVRKLFIAAVRFHGYYQSLDGITWTRLSAQPGSGLTTLLCPTNSGGIGSIDCPIFRGTLAVNPQTGDTFAWTVDANNQDQGLWRDQCALSGGACASENITFAQRWNTSALETNTNQGAATIANGDYNLALAAVPSQQDTLLLAGANDLWKCSLAMGCVWRNTTNATTCMSAHVAEYQHALAWNTANPLEIFVGNDSGLWRSTDALGETGQVCAATDASHFQNLNGSLGSLAEVVSMSATANSPYTMMAGLGVNGTAGVKSSTGPTADWPQILGGEGGPVAIDPTNSANWYVNNEAGVSIYLGTPPTGSTPGAFSPVLTYSTDAPNTPEVVEDGLTMNTAAPFLVDPVDSTQLLIGTCRVWRGPANGIGWSGGNAISPILDEQASPGPCSGNSLIRAIAAMPLPGAGEVVYVGMYGSLDGGATLAGHVLSATYHSVTGNWSAWQDLTLNPVTNDSLAMNYYGLDISSIFIDSHDTTGNTVYVTVAGIANSAAEVQVAYRSTDGGAHWAAISSNLPFAPANSLVVDPEDANTVYIATDAGVSFTTGIATCANAGSNCWSAFGAGLPEAPVVQLSASPAASSAQVLVAATYGRGIWDTPLWTAKTGLTTAIASPANPVTFATPVPVNSSSTLMVTVTNMGSLPLTSTTPPAVSVSDFNVTADNCTNTNVQPGASCTITVTFAPTSVGTLTGQMTIYANVYGGQLQPVELTGTGTPAGLVTLTPASISFDPAPGQTATSAWQPVEVGTTSGLFPVGVQNTGSTAVSIIGIGIASPFTIVSNLCGTSTLQPQAYCQVQLAFAPTQRGTAVGTLTLTDGAGTQTVALSGFGWAPPTDSLPATSLSFGGVAVGQSSTPQTIPLSNTGDLPLTCIVAWAGGPSMPPANCLSQPSSGPFTESDNCNGQLTGNQSCSISVVYAPSQLGSQTGTLTVSDALRTQTVALNGTGVLPPAIGVSPSSLSFAGQQVSVASSPLTLTVTNTGGAPMANVGFQMTGQAAGSFSTGATTCPTSSGATLANRTSCTVQVIFTPATAGGSAATLTITSSTLGVTPVTVPLNGTGQVWSGLNVDLPQLNFGVTTVGQSSAAQTVTVSNTSSSAASPLAFAVPAQFSLTQNTCTGILAAGANCTVGVTFQPTAVGAATGVLTISSASVATPATVLLSGTGGVGAAIQVAPGAIVFATTAPGATSSQTTVTVTNTGISASLSNLVLAVTAGFQLVNNTCPTALAPGLSCTAGVEFAPATAGPQTGTLTVTSSAVAAGASVPLSGMGLDFTLAVSGSASKTVSSGQSASYTLTITPLNGSGGTFTFACGALPANALCLFNPTTETLSGITGNVTVEISTGKASAQLMGPAVWRVLPLACGLVLLPLGWRRRRKALLLVALLSILAGGISSCTSSGGGSGGGSGGSSGSGPTPAGTYSIPVTAASGNVEHSVTLTLTVD